MFSNLLKNLSILKKFLFLNLIFFTIIGLLTFAYLKNVQPNLIKKKSSNHIEIINNTIDNLVRLDVEFIEEDIRKFLFSTRFLFQNLDRVIFFDKELNLVGDTDTLDLDPRSFTTRLDTVELEILNEKKTEEIIEKKDIDFGNSGGNFLNAIKRLGELEAGIESTASGAITGGLKPYNFYVDTNFKTTSTSTEGTDNFFNYFPAGCMPAAAPHDRCPARQGELPCSLVELPQAQSPPREWTFCWQAPVKHSTIALQ